MRSRTRMSTLTSSIHCATENPSQSNQARKRNESHQTQKGKNMKLSVYILLYIENSKQYTHTQSYN